MTARTPAGVVLTGGASTRMGTDKALVEIEGRPMAVRVADALGEAGCRPVWCQGGDIEQLARLGLDVVADTSPGWGPVPAILNALEQADGSDVVVAACDLVALDSAIVTVVVEAATDGDEPLVTVATAGGHAHLLSWWSASAVSRLTSIVDAGVRSYRDALTSLQAVEVEVPAAAMRNANHPDDLP